MCQLYLSFSKEAKTTDAEGEATNKAEEERNTDSVSRPDVTNTSTMEIPGENCL